MNKELWDLIAEKYDDIADTRQKGLLRFMSVAVQEYGHEDDILQYLKEYPDATVDELDEYAATFWPPVEIVDDDELDYDDDDDYDDEDDE